MTARVYFDWTETRKFRLASIVQKYSAHIKTKETLNEKWVKILDKLKSDADFAQLSIQTSGLEATFKRFLKEVLQKAGILEEGPNLFGRPEQPSDYEALMILLGKEAANQKAAREDGKQKKRKIQKALLTHEQVMLGQQAKQGSSSTSVDMCDSSLTRTNNSSINNEEENSNDPKEVVQGGGASKKPARGRTYFDTIEDAVNKLTQRAPEEIAFMQEERRRKLELEVREMEQRLDHNERQIRLQEEQVALQRAQLEFFKSMRTREDHH